MLKTIVAGVDGREGGRDALALAGRLALLAGGELVAVRALPFDAYAGRGGGPQHSALADAEAQRQVEHDLAEAGLTARTRLIVDTSPARALHRMAEALDADVIVVGSTRHGAVGGVFAGDDAAATLHASSCAVAVAPRGLADEEWTPVSRIGVGLDASAEAHQALALAVALATDCGASLVVRTVVPAPIADADLTAPFSGYILARNIELGNLTAPGTVAFTIADTSAVKIGFGIPEYALRQLRLGQEFTIHLQDDPKEYKGRVTSIAAGADEKNRVFAIEVTVPNPKSYLKPGMIASLNLSGVQNAPVPSVPLSAVVANPAASGRYAVFVGTEQAGKWTAHLRDVTLGETHESDVAIGGLKPGEKVVVSGTADLKDGDLIQVLP